jgi:hypothetical protein
MYGSGTRGVSRIHRHSPVGGEKHLSNHIEWLVFSDYFLYSAWQNTGGDDEFLKPPSILSPSPLNKYNSGSKVQTFLDYEVLPP